MGGPWFEIERRPPFLASDSFHKPQRSSSNPPFTSPARYVATSLHWGRPTGQDLANRGSDADEVLLSLCFLFLRLLLPTPAL